MTLLRNATPWLAEAIPFVDDTGAEGRLVVVKVQYDALPDGTLRWRNETEPLVYEDRFDETFAADGFLEGMAPLLRPADVMDPQPATNVLLFGHAQLPPRQREDGGVKQFEPWLGVGPAVFPMRVHGPRRWQSRWLLTRALTLFIPRRFKIVKQGRVSRAPLLWQLAYGGIDRFRGLASAQPWRFNPAGQGFHVEARAATVQALPLPAIEDPRHPIRRWQDRRLPQLPGAVNARWAPRAAHGGTRDAHWQATRAPAMPVDGTRLFHNTAHPDLQITPHLQGGEPVQAQGFTADGQPLAFDLPALKLSLHSYHYGAFCEHPLPLNTLLIDADARRVTLLYRAFVPELKDGNRLRRLALGSADHSPDMLP